MAKIEAYLDESGTHDGAPVLCVAGYLFTSERGQALDVAWRGLLEKHRVPFFHMVDCVHGNGPFAHLSRDERVAAEREAIAAIRDHMLFGAATTVNEPDYDTWSARQELGSAYTYCCWQNLKIMHLWLTENSIDGDIAYFFEAGSAFEGEAANIMQIVSGNDDLRKEFRYASHSFVSKEVRLIQTPDIFAWLHANHFTRLEKGEKRPRKDYKALVESRPHKALHATRESVAAELVFGHPELRNDPNASTDDATLRE